MHTIFGADAALYLTIERYGVSYRVINSVAEVAISAKLVDLRTGVQLWQGSAVANSAEQNNGHGGGLIGLLVSAAVTQILNNVNDQSHHVAAVAGARLLSGGHPNGLLFGPYHPKFGTD